MENYLGQQQNIISKVKLHGKELFEKLYKENIEILVNEIDELIEHDPLLQKLIVRRGWACDHEDECPFDMIIDYEPKISKKEMNLLYNLASDLMMKYNIFIRLLPSWEITLR